MSKPSGYIKESIIGVVVGLSLYYIGYKVSAIKKKKMLLAENKIIVGNKFNVYLFILEFEKLDLKRPVIIEITSFGGNYHSFFQAIEYIYYKKSEFNFEIICHIPFYACSGGWLLAQCADRFVMNKHSSVSPFDSQIVIQNEKEKSNMYPLAMIKNIKNKDLAKINLKNEYFKYVATTYNLLSKEKFDMIAKMNKWTDERKNEIYDTFMSGKYPHNENFMAHQLIKLGYCITFFQ